MLAGNVVSAAIRQAQLRSQIEITRQMLALEEQTLNITEQRYQAGGVSAVRRATASARWWRRRGHVAAAGTATRRHEPSTRSADGQDPG